MYIIYLWLPRILNDATQPSHLLLPYHSLSHSLRPHGPV